MEHSQRIKMLGEVASHRRSYVRRMAKAAIAEEQGRDGGWFIDKADEQFMEAVWKLDVLQASRNSKRFTLEGK